MAKISQVAHDFPSQAVSDEEKKIYEYGLKLPKL